MDAWLLLCMIFVALALFEYAVQLAIRYRGMREKSKKPLDDIEKESKEICRKIDRWALRIFVGLDVLVVASYFYFVSQQR